MKAAGIQDKIAQIDLEFIQIIIQIFRITVFSQERSNFTTRNMRFRLFMFTRRFSRFIRNIFFTNFNSIYSRNLHTNLKVLKIYSSMFSGLK